jgi:hypothetical protein
MRAPRISCRSKKEAPEAISKHRFNRFLRELTEKSRMGPPRAMGLFTEDIKARNDLFVHTLRDIYYAEQQTAKRLPDMIEKATDQNGFETHGNKAVCQNGRPLRRRTSSLAGCVTAGFTFFIDLFP